jgi:hypothetical protein
MSSTKRLTPSTGVTSMHSSHSVTPTWSSSRESSGLELDQTLATLFRLRDGKAVSMRDYPTRAEALKAAGLRE